MAHLLDFLAARGHRDRLNVVFEGGHPNVKNCSRIFDDLKQRYERFGVHSLGSFPIERKETCAPLMLADYSAGAYSMIRAKMSFDEIEGQADDYQPLRSGPARYTYLELKPDALQTLKTEFERLRQRDIDRWRAERVLSVSGQFLWSSCAAPKASSSVHRSPGHHVDGGSLAVIFVARSAIRWLRL
jgi:hypothetical protein